MSTGYENLDNLIEGEAFFDNSHRIAYATDASAYRELPAGVIYPKTVEDIQKIVEFANEHHIALIPRGAGTSLAGQVVGSGLVVDVSKYFRTIHELNVEERWVVVEPGVILNELNQYLSPFNLFFAPETSTASRCTIGGMLGNNSCGLHSVVYRSTRDHVLEVEAVLSDGTQVVFGTLSNDEFEEKRRLDSLEGELYEHIYQALSDPGNKEEIQSGFPDFTLPRKNTGYAVDELLNLSPFNPGGDPFNFSKIIAGSEGTLAFSTKIKLNLMPLPPKTKAVMCVHFHSLEEALKANIIALKNGPEAVELMDEQVLKLTENNLSQRENRFFVQGSPGAILIIEIIRDSEEAIRNLAARIESELRQSELGYHYPLIFGAEKITKVWDLRRAALGVLSNMPGDAKPVSVIEDTAIHPNVLPEYISEFKEVLEKYGLSCVFHAHVGSGEIHTRPILDLKVEKDVAVFKQLATDVALLVKKYRGSLSGEHGDGRLRGEFIPIIFGEKNYELLRRLKQTWDPKNIFNPGKIIDCPPMNESLRYVPGVKTKEMFTLFDFSDTMGIVRAVERCNGSGDCRSTVKTGKVMCPSYQATNDEMLSTRARANLLREFITYHESANLFDQSELFDVLDLCLSCKSCKSECPSSVDMAKLKAEFLEWYYRSNKPSLGTRLIANTNRAYRLGSMIPGISNLVLGGGLTQRVIKHVVGFHKNRSLPKLYKITLGKWASKNLDRLNTTVSKQSRRVIFFNDELSNYIDTATAITAVELLVRLGYRVKMLSVSDSGRVLISKGYINTARRIAESNIEKFYDAVSDDSPLIGLDPSTILTFRDEYIDLTRDNLKMKAKKISDATFLIEEFLSAEMDQGNIDMELFTDASQHIIFHGHCHQKALSTTSATQKMLSFPKNYTAEMIDAGCCGMAGTFGYEKRHYDLSVKIGEMRLFPAVRSVGDNTLIAAPGLSCRQQICDNTGRQVTHPATVLFNALNNHE